MDGTGLLNYRNRYYNPAWGRFISEDRIGLAGGDINLYRYVTNNPVQFSDPSGNWAFVIPIVLDAVAAAAAAAGAYGAGQTYLCFMYGACGAPSPTPSHPKPPQSGDPCASATTFCNRALQTGGNTLEPGTARGLNEGTGQDLSRRDWGRALEALKDNLNLPNDHHGQIWSNGDYRVGRVVLGNLLDYIR